MAASCAQLLQMRRMRLAMLLFCVCCALGTLVDLADVLHRRMRLAQAGSRAAAPACSTHLSVLSARGNAAHRAVMRRTWQRAPGSMHFFVGDQGCPLPPERRAPQKCAPVGRAGPRAGAGTGEAARRHARSERLLDAALVREQREHADLVLLPIVDHYHNLTAKVLLALEWHLQHHRNASFFVKVDDDQSAEDVALLERALCARRLSAKVAAGGDVWAGQYKHHLYVHRYGRAAEKTYRRDSWWFAQYPPFMNGAFYALSRGLALRVARLARQHPAELQHFTGEDLNMAHAIRQLHRPALSVVKIREFRDWFGPLVWHLGTHAYGLLEWLQL